MLCRLALNNPPQPGRHAPAGCGHGGLVPMGTGNIA
jgi:hypothetical protein